MFFFLFFFRGKPNLLDMGSLIIKPVQRVMKYPLLLAELWNATPMDHPDNRPLQEALTTVKIINVNINEFKRRKDIGETYIGSCNNYIKQAYMFLGCKLSNSANMVQKVFWVKATMDVFKTHL